MSGDLRHRCSRYEPLLARVSTAGVAIKCRDCVAADALVATSDGPMPIQDVTVGQDVWAWDNGQMVLRPVSHILTQGVQDTIRIATRRRAILVTSQHRMAVLRLTHKGKGPGNFNGWSMMWEQAASVRRGDWLVTHAELPEVPRARSWLSDGTAVDPDVAWFLGVFAADGNVHRTGPFVCVYGDVRDEVRRILSDVWGLASTPSAQHGVWASSASLRDALRDVGLGRPSTERTVPAVILRADPKIRRAFLDGYAAGDGYIHVRAGRREIGYSATSRQLVAEVRALHLGLGDHTSNLADHPRTQPIVIRGRLVRNARPLVEFTVWPDSKKDFQTMLGRRGARRALPDQHFTVDHVASVSPGPRTATFDLTVPGAESFLAEGFLVHNCRGVVTFPTTMLLPILTGRAPAQKVG